METPGRNQTQQLPQVRVKGDLAAGQADHLEPQVFGLGEDRVRGLQGQKTCGVRLVAEAVPAGTVALIRGFEDDGFHPMGNFRPPMTYQLTLKSNS